MADLRESAVSVLLFSHLAQIVVEMCAQALCSHNGRVVRTDQFTMPHSDIDGGLGTPVREKTERLTSRFGTYGRHA